MEFRRVLFRSGKIRSLNVCCVCTILYSKHWSRLRCIWTWSRCLRRQGHTIQDVDEIKSYNYSSYRRYEQFQQYGTIKVGIKFCEIGRASCRERVYQYV